MYKKFLVGVLAMLLAGCSLTPMTEEERRVYNSGPFSPECVFTPDGNPVQSSCRDYRLVNHKYLTGKEGISLSTPGGFYYKPAWPDPVSVVLPEDFNVIWFDAVSKTEVACRKLLTESVYPASCYVEEAKTAYVTYGDWPSLEAQVKRHKRAYPTGEDE